MKEIRITKAGCKVLIILLLLTMLPAAIASQPKQASVLLQEGLYAEEINGDLEAAIKIYQQVIDDNSAQKNLVAQALYRQGMCYMKLRNDKLAQSDFQRLVADFSDQTSIVEKVRPLLENLTNADPAALMPPDTLLYVEIGNPGKQIQTILNMLKGSPLENPLALIGRNTGAGPQQEAGAANIVSALLNPNMIAEFEKIRGMGAGITGIPTDGTPPAIVVLFPGKSDALKGLLQMALNLAGKPIDNIEGMQCIEFQDGGGAAYDDSTYIIVSPPAFEAGQLTWCVEQYKHITNEPTLASSNKSFVQVSKQARQSNALTVWVDLDAAYTEMVQAVGNENMPPQLQMADRIIDFKNIRDIIAFLSIEPTSLALEANIAFNEGANCIAYNIIRTPHLGKNAFQAVPPEAIGLLSFALSDVNSIQAASVGKQLQSMTGLDFGRQIFANIEQVTLFLLPSDNNVLPINNEGLSYTPKIGVAITSRNPAQIQQLIGQMLTITGLVSNNSAAAQAAETQGKYTINLTNGMQLCYYQNQNSNTTILSVNPEIVDASIAAVQSQKSALTAGPLQKQLSAISPDTSKLLLLNLEGCIQTGMATVNAGSEEETANIRNLFGDVATGFEDTTIEIRTNESVSDFNISASINDFPPVSAVFSPIMQIVSTISGPPQNSPDQEKLQAIPVVIAHTDNSPVIDGKAEDIWSKAQKLSLDNRIFSPPSSEEDLSADYQAMWDKDNLYVFVDVRDESLKKDSADFYQDDAVEIFIDADNSKSGQYDNNDYQYYFVWDRDNPAAGIYNRGDIQEAVKYKLVTNDTGYSLEVMFPWATLGTQAHPGAKIGLDVHVNDDDDGGDRDSKITWRDKSDNAYQDPGVFGTAELAGLVGWWKFDEGQGNIAADSSSNGNNGTLEGNPAWQPAGGKIGGAISLDGDGDYIDLPVGSVISYLPECTFSTWVNWSGEGAPWQRILDFGTDEGNYVYVCPSSGDSNSLRVAITAGNGIWDEFDSTRGALTPGWHHITVTFSKNSGLMALYLDGEIVGSKNDCVNSISDLGNVTNNWLGRSQYPSDPYFNGSLDDFRIYNYALNDNEILALYNGK